MPCVHQQSPSYRPITRKKPECACRSNTTCKATPPNDAIDIAGTAASAKLTLVHGEVTFIDYFVLLKTEHGWKIANKAFYAQTN